MKKLIIIFILGFFLFGMVGLMTFVFASSGGSPVMAVEANILGPQPSLIRIEVPDSVFVGNVSKGGETDKVRVDINNTGNVNVTITPQLVNQSDMIFSNLYFIRRTSDVYRRIGNWSMNISAPTGSFEDDYFYMRLDLRNFNGSITEDILGKKADVKFIATQSV